MRRECFFKMACKPFFTKSKSSLKNKKDLKYHFYLLDIFLHILKTNEDFFSFWEGETEYEGKEWRQRKKRNLLKEKNSFSYLFSHAIKAVVDLLDVVCSNFFFFYFSEVLSLQKWKISWNYVYFITSYMTWKSGEGTLIPGRKKKFPFAVKYDLISPWE